MNPDVRHPRCFKDSLGRSGLGSCPGLVTLLSYVRGGRSCGSNVLCEYDIGSVSLPLSLVPCLSYCATMAWVQDLMMSENLRKKVPSRCPRPLAPNAFMVTKCLAPGFLPAPDGPRARDTSPDTCTHPSPDADCSTPNAHPFFSMHARTPNACILTCAAPSSQSREGSHLFPMRPRFFTVILNTICKLINRCASLT